MDSRRQWERLPTTDAELHTETGSLYPQIKPHVSETLQSSIELPRHVTVIGFPMPDPETGTRGDHALTGVTLERSVPGGFEKALWWDRFAFFPHPVCNTISIGKTNGFLLPLCCVYRDCCAVHIPPVHALIRH